jgi:hypothetical protein
MVGPVPEGARGRRFTPFGGPGPSSRFFFPTPAHPRVDVCLRPSADFPADFDFFLSQGAIKHAAIELMDRL